MPAVDWQPASATSTTTIQRVRSISASSAVRYERKGIRAPREHDVSSDLGSANAQEGVLSVGAVTPALSCAGMRPRLMMLACDSTLPLPFGKTSPRSPLGHRSFHSLSVHYQGSIRHAALARFRFRSPDLAELVGTPVNADFECHSSPCLSFENWLRVPIGTPQMRGASSAGIHDVIQKDMYRETSFWIRS